MYSQQQNTINMNRQFGGNNSAMGRNGMGHVWNQLGASGIGQRDGVSYMDQMQKMRFVTNG